jgi:hypothetical protein
MGRIHPRSSIGQDADTAVREPIPTAGFQDRRKRRRRSGVIFSITILTVFGLILFAATATNLPSRLFGGRMSQHAMSGPQSTTGSIVHYSATDRCRRTIFSNETGRVLETDRPCENHVMVDEKGEPIPMGTARRLDAISKSFSK